MAERPVPVAPTQASLHEAALSYLARYAATEAGLRTVLNRRIDRWARATGAAAEDVAALKSHARTVAARCVTLGLVNDADYALSRVSGLLRAGRSRRAVSARLAAKGVAESLVRDALPDDPEAEMDAALVLARKRRIGPFRRTEDPDPAAQRRELAMLARAGFPQAVAARALAMDAAEAEARVLAFRR